MSFVYRGLEAKLERHIVTEHDVELQIEHILAETPKHEHVTDRKTQLGDEVILDYAGFCEGEQFQGGTAERQSLTLGSGMFIPGFEEQLVGKEIGEEVSVMVTFPEAYHAENLAGKPAEFRCKIHEIHVNSKYELDDEFAREVGNCETMEEFREKLAFSMQSYADERAELELQEKLIRQAAETLGYEPTEEEIEKEIEIQMGNLSAELAQRGLNLEMYCAFTGTTEEQIRADAGKSAATSVRLMKTVDKIVELENIKIEEEEIDQAIALFAQQNGMSYEEMKSYINDEMKEALVRSMILDKVMRVLRENAVITEECSHCHSHCHCDDHCHDDHCHCEDDHCHCDDDHCHCH